MKVIARGRRSTEEAIETASEIEISILSQRSEASIDFRCIPDCLFIPNRDSRKLSIGYQNVINVKCKNCHERQLFDAIRYRLVLANGTKTEWKTTKNTKIPVLKQVTDL
ncbi:hypothetical protein L596_012513 [Steinernema carpocapsae]|uniref:Uncharacterized protein n=1 Tax=Steinernema carpocapsae TaxID=34508 RepID=A0A4U5NY80_STECR|nr:hypothetical protein L596_012513 [Steinernema carpocapsae]